MDRIVVDCAEKGCRKPVKWALRLSCGLPITRSCHPHLHKVALALLKPYGYKGPLLIESI